MEAPKIACPICLEDIHQEASVVHPCNHAFCLECITKWTDNTPTCPLCLKPVDKITRSKRSEEDAKEETYELKVTAKGTKKSADEEFECFDHDYFVHQFRELLRQAKDAEFNLKSQIGIKKKALQLEKNYQLALHMKQEIEMKLNYLARIKKISPRDLLEDIQHFCDLLAKINYSEEAVYYDEYGYADEGQYDDGYGYYGEEADNDHYSMYSVAVTKSVPNKKKSKNKQKNKKDGVEPDKARIALS